MCGRPRALFGDQTPFDGSCFLCLSTYERCIPTRPPAPSRRFPFRPPPSPSALALAGLGSRPGGISSSSHAKREGSGRGTDPPTILPHCAMNRPRTSVRSVRTPQRAASSARRWRPKSRFCSRPPPPSSLLALPRRARDPFEPQESCMRRVRCAHDIGGRPHESPAASSHQQPPPCFRPQPFSATSRTWSSSFF